MDLAALLKFLLLIMFSPPGIANFIICTLLKKRIYASIAAVIAASAFMFFNQAVFGQQAGSAYTVSSIIAVLAMLITSHVAFTIGEKVIRANLAKK
ncbi:hypothetical protein C0081_00355 [Cohaesibacter celericrescens]|uniref:Uncharacterized protein n=2 Tax=Cohaesibacter celericrescens TaxID=2067669 RepID=A0A2N5XW42_9HYPH|nr:hypothetical protein C0081_00355 [Cohaesibacter celericrescens]